ncbi:MAG: hypothetical protein SNJ78_06585 [Spirochaetales bacterium]
MAYKRRHKTKPAIILLDHVSRGIITIGGIGIIVAVFLVFVFLGSVVLPLFQRGSLHNPQVLSSLSTYSLDKDLGSFLELDEFKTSGYLGLIDGKSLLYFFVPSGEIVKQIPLFKNKPASFYYDHLSNSFIAGFEDGSTQTGTIRFETSFYEPQQIEEGILKKAEKGVFLWDEKVVEKTSSGQIRITEGIIQTQEPLIGFFQKPVVKVDKVERPNGKVIAGFYNNGILFVRNTVKRTNFLTGQETETVEERDYSIQGLKDLGVPDYLFLLSFGDTLLFLRKNGDFYRIDLRSLENQLSPTASVKGKELPEHGTAGTPESAQESKGLLIEAPLVEKGNIFALLPSKSIEPSKTSEVVVTQASMLLGRSTLLVGDSLGRFSSWHVGREQIGSDTVGSKEDRTYLLCSRLFEGPAPVRSIASSTRKRMVTVGYADGTVRVYFLTSERLIAEAKPFDSEEVLLSALSPKDNGAAFLGKKGTLIKYQLDEGHPEFSLKAVFTPVLYEGNAKPEHIWQSSSGTDSFELKLGLIPLVFGTLKATFYSLLFGVPIALLAAIYTSEFLHPDQRARIKPLIEIMASLPSVVLGFLAALVFAPFVERVVPAILFGFFALPFTFYLSGYLIQFFPKPLFIMLSRYRFWLLLGVSLPLGITFSVWGGPILEQLLFYGNLKGWLNGDVGTGWPGWVIILLPLALVAGSYLTTRLFRLSKLQEKANRWHWIKLLLGSVFTLALAIVMARTLDGLGVDPRNPFPLLGRLLGTYVQRNSVVVGFLMGFAIIPIIYTIADDALKSVPQSLRAAALSLGATPWQTTFRVVIPTAMSGLFSAVMIGFGRAVGETMIVLMATGNTPVLEWNPFNGFRTLAANIAVELPEAVVHSTHYRILFLAALTLFIMTFIVNTLAELQRLRFRAKAYQL